MNLAQILKKKTDAMLRAERQRGTISYTVDESGLSVTPISNIPTEPYALPQATSSELGGIKAEEKTTEDNEVKIDPETGKLYAASGGGSYTLPQATESALGGIKAAAKTSAETQEVKIGDDERLYVPPAGQAANGLPVGGTAGQILTKTDGTDYNAGWVNASSGGGTPKDRIYIPKGTDLGYDDEFDNGSLAAAWTAVDVSSYANTWTEAENVKGLSCLVPSGKGSMKLCGLLKPFSGLSAPFYIQTAVRLYSRSQNYPGAGLIFADGVSVGSGVQVCGFYATDVGLQASRWTNYTARASLSEIGTENNGFVNWLHIRLVYESSNTFRLLTSLDGVNWVDINGTLSYTITPTYFGICESTFDNSSYPLLINFAYFRVRSGLSANG